MLTSAYFDRVRAGRCLAFSVVVPPPLVPTPLHDFIERVRDGRSLLFCGGTPPPPSADFDIFGATPFDGSAFTAPIAPDSFGLDFGVGEGPSAGFLAGRPGSTISMRGHVELGDNTLDDDFRAAIFLNDVDTGQGLTIPAGTDGDFSGVFAVPYLASSVLDLRPISAAGSGALVAPRFAVALGDT